jgi:hypothetical protein
MGSIGNDVEMTDPMPIYRESDGVKRRYDYTGSVERLSGSV